MPWDADTDDEIKRMTVMDPLRFSRKWRKLSTDAKEIVTKMLEKDPQKRCSLEDLLGSRWITSGNSDL